ncbi:FAD/NAD(P)-binding domain-containing protein [Nadsonia fulvescens var. elongata DSM 6958]|uniref:FAD/NAD(P)-binding domain-containing protein n=1 Tax=Nadsonia fulvescens var. elongata DSM 6958 TaxID=857566 RepID=A0A1E3PTE7_9ASCO|nr:FAD/NAD(P)-binding domain-containing protein [Nadsonia fulvescens var. elongata DSM 6958]
MTRTQSLQSVAVIGGGSSGLAVCKALKAENSFLQIQNYTEEFRSASNVPSVDPFKEEPPYILKDDKPIFYTPIYKHLNTDISNGLIKFNNFPYPKGTDLFPSRQNVLKYIQSYGEGLREHISLNSQIISAKKLDCGMWELTVRHLDQGCKRTTHFFDAIIIATNKYDTPFIPDVLGLKAWSKVYSDSITHSKYFIDNKPYEGKRVLVIGNSASGIDLASQIADTAESVYRSIRSESKMAYSIETRVSDVATVQSYDVETKTIFLNDGTVLKDIDSIVYCTGYMFSLPYMKSYFDGKNAIITTGGRLNKIYKQIFYIPDPTLAFVGMSTRVIPFPTAETQGAVIARVLSGRLELPNQTEMLESENEEEKERGSGSEFHELPYPLDIEYINSLQAWTNQAEPKDVGLHSEIWTEDMIDLRVNSFEYKKQHLSKKLGITVPPIKEVEPFKSLL